MDDGVPRELSAAARSVWAKSSVDHTSGELLGSIPLWRHLDDTAAVAGRLWDEWLPSSVRRVVASCVDGDGQRARRLAVWLAGVHDVGKATPVFAVQNDDLAHRMKQEGLEIRGPYANRRELRHELAGHICVVRWLGQRHGWSASEADRLAVVVGGHHGIAPTALQIEVGEASTAMFGTGRWISVQDEHLDRQARLLGDDGLLGRPFDLNQPAQVVLTALVIVADWIASNEDYFPYSTWETTATRLDRAWRRLDLPRPWSAEPISVGADELLTSRFGMSGSARPVQTTALDMAARATEPGLIVIEAPMGEGKTEAALMAAEALAARTGAGGCFIALPTQATTDAMFGRVRAWMDRLPGGPQSVFLAHGKAALNDEYRGLVANGRSTAVAIDDDGGADGRRREATGYAPALAVNAIVHEWLQGRKKGVLASFVVGTVDQTLFAALKSRHLVLRHLALAGKVVVIDEVHAYDVYMSSYLDRALHWLGAYGAPVVLLSATLPAGRRDDLVTAYRSGQAARHGRKAGRSIASSRFDYPLITATAGPDEVIAQPTPASGRRSEIQLERMDDDLPELGELLTELLTGGGCVLVVRNTVARVQETGRYLADRFGADTVTVVHARFLAIDRAGNDAMLLERFGPTGTRPQTHIVVGSQVVEQSLDVDFDLLVSDVAPVDLLLQRMGRLHRHARGVSQCERPPRLRAPRCVLTGVDDWSAVPPRVVDGSRRVYDDDTLLRSLAVLGPHLDGAPVVLPDHIAPLVQTAYSDEPVGPPGWQETLADARAAARATAADALQRATSFQLAPVDRAGGPVLGWVRAGVGDVADEGPRGEAQVRDGQLSLEVLVVVRTADGLTTPAWIGPRGGELLAERMEIPRQQAAVVAACSLRLPLALSSPGRIDATIADLERNWVPDWQRSPLLAGQLILVLDPEGRASVAGHDLHYTRTYGLEVKRA